MFTGIIERTAKVISLTIPAKPLAAKSVLGSITQLIIDPEDNTNREFTTKPGDSIAINGCCLTVTKRKMGMLAFDVSRETLSNTSLGELHEGAEINLERALRLGDRLGGHFVSGHVDGVGTVEFVKKRADGWNLSISVPLNLGRYMIPKGSACLDGVSLTINGVMDYQNFTQAEFTLVPTTVSLTSLKNLFPGQKLNLEVDMMAKFAERLSNTSGKED
jgi:riboflavin synthase